MFKFDVKSFVLFCTEVKFKQVSASSSLSTGSVWVYMQVMQVMQVMQDMQVMQVMQVMQDMQVMQVMQVM